MERDKMDLQLQQAADRALAARDRIERAVDAGELPGWVMAICEQWERAAFNYGASSALQRPLLMPTIAQSRLIH